MTKQYISKHGTLARRPSEKATVSIVVPVYNELENVPLLHDEIQNAMQDIGQDWEVVYVDDGSTDGSAQALEAVAARDAEHVRVVSLRRNFGQTAAISAGIDFSSGEIIVLMDGDRQNHPGDVPKLLAELENGYDLVSGWRKDRQDSYLTRTLPSNIANWIISQVTNVHLHDYGCTLKAYRREILTDFRLYGEMHRFIPAYAGYVGARITEVPVRHRPRVYGQSKYGLERTVKVVLDLLTVKYLSGYFYKPIYLFGGIGILLGSTGVLGLVYLMLRKLITGGGIVDSPVFLLSALLLLLGAMAVLLGLIAEMVVRTYHESQSKPIYNVRYVIREDE